MGHRPTTLWCEYGKEFTWAYLFPTIKTMHSMNPLISWTTLSFFWPLFSLVRILIHTKPNNMDHSTLCVSIRLRDPESLIPTPCPHV
ncbi:hypothetical protein YC2023_000440 [Brassica napus]